MKHRNPLAVFFLSLITLGIYALVWHVKTKGELTKLGADITYELVADRPFANLYWIWKYSQGVEQVSGRQDICRFSFDTFAATQRRRNRDFAK